jgi:O-antigen/teichoic acid export membrane protein
MNILKSKLAASLGIYTLANVLNAAIPFLLLPILTDYLSTEDYGILSNFNGIITVAVPFVGINFMAAVSLQYIKPEIDKAKYISTGLWILGSLTIFFSVILSLFTGYIEEKTGVPAKYIHLIGVYALFSNLMEVILAIWRMENKAVKYGIFRIGRTIVELSIALVLIVLYSWPFEGSIYAMYISYGLAAVLTIFMLWRKQLIVFSFSKAYSRHIFRYGIPLIPHALSGAIMMYSDKLIITEYVGLSAAGIYSVGFLVGQIVGLFQNSFNQAWVPWAFQQLQENKPEMKLKMVKMTYLYFIGIILFTLALWLITPLVFYFIGKDFKAGMDLVLWVALGFAFNGMYKMVSVYLFYAEKTMQIAWLSIGAAILNILLNLWWIPYWGVIGASLATMLTLFIQFVCTWILSASLIQMPWNLKK